MRLSYQLNFYTGHAHANSAFHPFGVDKWVVIHGLRGWRPLNGRPGWRMVGWS